MSVYVLACLTLLPLVEPALTSAAYETLPGFHAIYYTENVEFFPAAAGETKQFINAWTNVGDQTWTKGVASKEVRLGTAVPLDNRKDFDAGWGPSWLAPNRYAVQDDPLVPSQRVGFFIFGVTVPATASLGKHYLYGRLIVEGLGWLEDYGYYQGVDVQAQAAPTYTVSVSPASATIIAGQTQQFTATVKDPSGKIVTGQTVTWSVSPATLGTISGSGLFTAGAAAVGNGTVTATLAGASAAATITVTGVPTKIVVTPGTASVPLGGTQQYTATVKDASGNSVPGQTVTWSVSPTDYGTISASGVFSAGGILGGAATVSAKLGSLVGRADIIVMPPSGGFLTVGGIDFRAFASSRTDIFVQADLVAAVFESLKVNADADVAQIESDYGRRFSVRAPIFVLSTKSSYQTGLQSILGLTASQAASLAATTTGVFYYPGETLKIAVDWQFASTEIPLRTLRHELTHLMIRLIAGPDSSAVIPVWLHEGAAALEEFTVGGVQWDVTKTRYYAASMAATQTLFGVTQLTSSSGWGAATALYGNYPYYQAAEMVRLLRADVGGMAGEVRILDLIAVGKAFNDAYATVAGKSSDTFAAAVPSRLGALAPSYPGIATATDTPAGAGLWITFYGFTPGTAMTFTLKGPNTAQLTRTISSFGSDSGYFTNLLGTYTITAVGDNGTVTVGVVLTTAASMWSPTVARSWPRPAIFASQSGCDALPRLTSTNS